MPTNSWDGTLAGAGAISTNAGDLGQSFTPTDTYLGGIEIEMGCCTPDTSATIRLDVHEGSFAGPIIGSSQLGLTDPTSIIVGNGVMEGTLWKFVPAASLAPGTLYVIEIVQVAGADVVLTTTGNNHPGGSRFFNGAPGSQDLVFRTGRFVADPQLYWVDAGLLTVEGGPDDAALSRRPSPPRRAGVDPGGRPAADPALTRVPRTLLALVLVGLGGAGIARSVRRVRRRRLRGDLRTATQSAKSGLCQPGGASSASGGSSRET